MAQKRPVAPDTPITSYPTPEVSDIVLTVDVDSRLPGYKPLEYGTLYSDQTRFPGAKLISQTPLDDDRFVRRIYATDRVNQDSYNYAIKYSAGSPDHPIYIRTTVEARNGYVPLADGAPDPVIAGAYLVDEEAAPADGELNSLYLKVTRVYETLPGPIVTSFDTNEAGQKVTVTSQRKTSTDYTLPQATALKSASAEADGTGVVNETIRTIPSIFTRKQFSAERPDMLPQKFRAAVPDVETSEIVEGTATQPSLLQGDISASETQQTLFLKQISRRSRSAPTYPVTIVESILTRQGQFATTTSVLEDGPQTADTGPLIESSEVTDLGDGRTIKVTTSVDTVFSANTFSAERPDPTPEKFRVKIPTQTFQSTGIGEAEAPTLGSIDLSRSEQQVTKFVKRISATQRSVPNNTRLTSKTYTSELGGGIATVDEFISTDSEISNNPTGNPVLDAQSVKENDPELGTVYKTGLVSAESEALGNDRFVKRVIKLDAIEELIGQDYDESLDIRIPFSQKIINAKTPLEQGPVVIQPRDVANSLRREYDVSAFSDQIEDYYWELPDLAQVNLPNRLKSAKVVFSLDKGSQYGSGEGTSYYYTKGGSSAVVGEMVYDIEEGYSGLVAATKYIFFLQKDNASITDVLNKIRAKDSENGRSLTKYYPNVRPISHNIAIVGGSITQEEQESVSLNSSSESSGTTINTAVGTSRTPPTIHPVIPIEIKKETVSYSMLNAEGETVISLSISPKISISGSEFPSDSSYTTNWIEGSSKSPAIPATDFTEFPDGRYLVAVNSSPYRFGYIRIEAMVADIFSPYVGNNSSLVDPAYNAIVPIPQESYGSDRILPSVPTGLSVSGTTSTGFQVSWESSEFANYYLVDVSTDQNFGSFVSGYQSKQVGLPYLVLSGLTPSTQYYVRVRSTNRWGYSRFGIAISHSTTA